MLTTSDIGDLFQSLRTVYGNQWRHGTDAMEVWRRALHKFDARALQRGAEQSIDSYPHHPPTLAQFKLLLTGQPRPASTYLPAPKTSEAMAAANRVMLAVLKESLGVDSKTLELMRQMKNALVEDWGEQAVTIHFINQVSEELTGLAAKQDHEKKAEETQQARRQHCIRQGMEFVE